ncbi:MAG: dihydropteroate synthase [Tumebacillaceae bacterium]
MTYNPHLLHSEHDLQRLIIRLDNVEQPALLQQELIALGGDVTLPASGCIVLAGTRAQLHALIANRPGDAVAAELADFLTRHAERHTPRTLAAGRYLLEFGKRTLIMGILNITPDSFSDGGRWADLDKAVEHAKRMIAEGADILDIGGESTRPGHAPVSAEEEIRRVVPVIERLAREVDIPISIDTYKSSVAAAAVRAGAHIVNDVWGGLADPEMAAVCAQLDCPFIIMDNRDTPYEDDVMAGVIRDMRRQIANALQAGVRDENLILDPGIGFGKTHEQNLLVMRHLDEITALGYPVLLGTSRKSMIGNALGLPVDQRVEGTAATVALGIAKGVDIVRVHDVKEMARVARMTDAMVR